MVNVKDFVIYATQQVVQDKNFWRG